MQITERRDISIPIIPVWKKQDEFGRWIWGLEEWAYNEIRDGLACGICNERWPTRQSVCNVCRKPADQYGLLVPIPPEWTAAIADRLRVDNERYEERDKRNWEHQRRMNGR